MGVTVGRERFVFAMQDRHLAPRDATFYCALRVIVGFDALEALLAADTERGNFCFGYSPTLADVYLIPQVEGARRFKVDILRWPNICAIDAAFSQLDSFRLAAPNQQPDAMG